jgi:hypothetical protein
MLSRSQNEAAQASYGLYEMRSARLQRSLSQRQLRALG